jgi:hypothetical protein
VRILPIQGADTSELPYIFIPEFGPNVKTFFVSASASKSPK